VAVRPELPWPYRTLAVALIACAVVGAAVWIARTAGLAGEGAPAGATSDVRALRDRVAQLERQLSEQRAASNVSDAALQIERTTHERLARQVKDLELENGRLKEDLALFEKLASTPDDTPRMTISGLHVEADVVPMQYRFRLVAALQGGRKEREFSGMMQVIVALQQGDKHAMMVLPGRGEAERERYAISFRHFRRVDGTFQVPEGARVISVEVRLLQDGATKASQRVEL
jgi:hypothetical protein